MKWVLLFTLLPVHAQAPSQFLYNGYDTEEDCHVVEKLVIAGTRKSADKQHLILWTACLPGRDAFTRTEPSQQPK